MKVSEHFRQALFYDQTSATDAFFSERANKLFVLKEAESCVEIVFQTTNISQRGLPHSVRTPGSALNSSFGSTSQGPHTLIPNGYSQPQSESEGGLKLNRQKVQDVAQLSQITLVSKHSFRVCFIRQRHSYSRLYITQELFEALMSELEIFPRFREFILLFGLRHNENEVGPPQMRFRRRTTSDSPSAGLTHRRYAGFECAYALRYVESTYRESNGPWSLCPSVIYHKYDVSDQSSTWVMVSASGKIEQCLDQYLKCSPNLVGLNPFEVHLLVLDAALADWRPYIINLTERIIKQADRVIVASIQEKDPLQLVDVDERQILKDFEDAIIDMLLVLDSTIDTISSLLENYKQFCLDIDVNALETNGEEFDPVAFAFREKHREVMFSRKKIETLQTKVQGMSNLSSSILDLGNGQSLKLLAEESRKENVTMRKLTEKSTQDAAAVKVLTMITLIYLPTTVVLNFFSTQFVGQEQPDGGAKRLVVTSNTWLFAAISVPLTFATVFVWWLWVQIQTHQLWPLICSIKSRLLPTSFKLPRRRRKSPADGPGIGLESSLKVESHSAL